MRGSSIGRPEDARSTVPDFFSKVLVVSGSSVFRELMRLILAPHSEGVLMAGDRKEGAQALMENGPIDVVLADIRLPDGDGFELLDDVATHADARPEVILVASEAVECDAQRTVKQGAAGYLVRPVSFRHVASALKRNAQRVDRREPRRRPGGRVCLLGFGEQIGTREAASPHLLFYARDVSATGAFLETGFPLPIGTRLDLTIEISKMLIRVTAEVVRAQAPSWGCSGGVGVRFTNFSDVAREALAAYVGESGADTY